MRSLLMPRVYEERLVLPTLHCPPPQPAVGTPGSGAFQKGHVYMSCIHMEAGSRPHSVLRGEGAMFAAAVVGGGSDSGILQELERTRDSCLAGLTRRDGGTRGVFISLCASRSLPQRDQQRRPGERRDCSAPGSERTIHPCDDPTHLYYTLTCESFFLRTCPVRAETVARGNPQPPSPLPQPSKGRPGTSGQTLAWLHALQGSRLPMG